MIPVLNTTKYDKNYCALVTVYNSESLEIDPEAYRKLVRYFTTSKDFLKHRGALIVNPEAGEIFYLTREEREALIKVVLEERPADMPIFAGCFGVRRDEMIESALHAKAMGVDGLFVLPPVGTMEVSTSIDAARNPEIWTDHVRAIAEASQLPLIIHAAGPNTVEWGVGLPVQSVKMVIENVPSVVGWKMVYDNIMGWWRAAWAIRSVERHVGILNVPLVCWHTAMICGLVDGGVKGGYNWIMEPLVRHAQAWEERDLEKVKRIFMTQLQPPSQYVFSDPSRLHIRYKVATWVRGLIPHPFMRPPMPPPRWEEAEALLQLMGKAGLSCITHEELESTFQRKDKILKA